MGVPALVLFVLLAGGVGAARSIDWFERQPFHVNQKPTGIPHHQRRQGRCGKRGGHRQRQTWSRSKTPFVLALHSLKNKKEDTAVKTFQAPSQTQVTNSVPGYRHDSCRHVYALPRANFKQRLRKSGILLQMRDNKFLRHRVPRCEHPERRLPTTPTQ